jgi:hypothetical protein
MVSLCGFKPFFPENGEEGVRMQAASTTPLPENRQ